jgi:hypothetical protein
MANAEEYRDQMPVPERRLREVSTQPGLMLTAMLAQRVRVERDDGPHWMSGFDALSAVLSERAAAGDTRAATLLANLGRYASRGETRNALPQEAAPQTDAERALAAAFVRRTLDGLPVRAGVAPGRNRRRRRMMQAV